MGNMILAASSTKPGGSSAFLWIGLLVLFGVLYFVMIRPQRNRQRQAQATQRDVEPGARVRTTAGMYATVAAVEGDDVILEVAPGVEVRYMRRAIMNVVPDGTETGFADGTQTGFADGTQTGFPAEEHEDPSHPYDEAEDDAATG